MGGEEFLILSLSDTTQGGKILAEKMRSTLEKSPVAYKQASINMTASIGVGFTKNQLLICMQKNQAESLPKND